MQAGVQNIKNLGSLIKLGAIAIAQAVGKDGFQPVDLLAPLNSAEFNAAVKPVIAGYKDLIIELSDIGVSEGLDLLQSAYRGWKDLKTELDVAAAKLKELDPEAA